MPTFQFIEEFCSLCRNWSHLYLCLKDFRRMKLHANQQLARCFYLLLTRWLTLCSAQKFWTQAVWYFHWRQAESKTLAFWQNTVDIQSCSYHNWELAISCPDGEQIVSCCLKRRLVSPLVYSKVPRWGEDMHYFTSLITLLEMSSLETYGLYLQKRNNRDEEYSLNSLETIDLVYCWSQFILRGWPSQICL